MAYGASADEALANARALAVRVIADRIEHGERPGGPRMLARIARRSGLLRGDL